MTVHPLGFILGAIAVAGIAVLSMLVLKCVCGSWWK